MRRTLLLLVIVPIGLAAAGCGGGDGKTVSPTAPEFKQPEVKSRGKQVGAQ